MSERNSTDVLEIPGLPGYTMSLSGLVYAPAGRMCREIDLVGTKHVVVHTPRGPALRAVAELWRDTWSLVRGEGIAHAH